MLKDQITVVLHPDKWDCDQLHTALNVTDERFDQLQDLALEMMRTTKTKSESFAKISTQVANVNELVLTVAAMYIIEKKSMMMSQIMGSLFKE